MIDPHAAYDALRWDRTDARYDRFRASLAGPPVLGCPEFGDSALTAAVWDNDPTAVALILRAGADPNGDSETLDPPVIAALNLEEGWRPMVLMLVAAGANLERGGLVFGAALHTAVRTGDIERVRLILDLGGEIDALAGDDETPLHLAARSNMLTICRLLLDRGANPLLRELCSQRTPAEAVRHRYPDDEELLPMLDAAEAEWRRREPNSETA